MDNTGLLLSHSFLCDKAQCAEDCPVRLLDEQSGVSKDTAHTRGKAGAAKFSGKYANGEIYTDTYDRYAGYTDEGGASRYFTTFPLESVRPLALMRWLVRLVCPPGGVVLDPFGGASTAQACIAENRDYILIEGRA
jgi:site-specific DNA-methyltransferase (adenine-specific)